MDDQEEKKGLSRIATPLLLLVVFLAMAGAIWWLANQKTGVRRSAPPITTVTMLPPPPPPPPPPSPKTPPPPEEKSQEVPHPEETPKAPSPPQQVTINGPAQAGSDSFGIQAGSGGGTVGSGGGATAGAEAGGVSEASYRRYMSGELTQALQDDKKLNRFVFTAEALIWVDGRGRITRATIARSAGEAKLDTAIVAALERLTLDQAPPPGVRFPQRVTLRGRKGL